MTCHNILTCVIRDIFLLSIALVLPQTNIVLGGALLTLLSGIVCLCQRFPHTSHHCSHLWWNQLLQNKYLIGYAP